MIKDSIALIGFMGTGKTIVGKSLAERLGNNFEFLETDDLIIELAGKSIPKIFSEDGEVVFRYFEIEACKMASNMEKVVISCGGGVVLNPINIDNLKKNCFIVLLTASVEEIYERVKKDGIQSRPVINKDDPLKEIKKVIKAREKLYKNAAEFIVNTTKKRIAEIVDEILTLLDMNIK